MSKPEHVRTHRFDPATLYIHDDGRVKCGAHVGTEATYTPQQWEAIGAAPRVDIEGMTLECEDSRCVRSRGGQQ